MFAIATDDRGLDQTGTAFGICHLAEVVGIVFFSVVSTKMEAEMIVMVGKTTVGVSSDSCKCAPDSGLVKVGKDDTGSGLCADGCRSRYECSRWGNLRRSVVQEEFVHFADTDFDKKINCKNFKNSC